MDKKNLQLPAGMGDRNPQKSVWDNIADHFKSKDPKPQAKVETNPNALKEVSKSFKSAF